MNPNDNTADIYDIVSNPLKPKELTDAELELITSLASPGESVLDIGAGTGRHAIPLSEQGYKVTVIDSSVEMLKVLSSRNHKIKVVEADILSYDLKPKSYCLVLLMWNAFDEIALTNEQAESLALNLKQSLVPGGKLLINVDNPDNFVPAELTFALSKRQGDLDYELDSHVVKYDATTRTTTSLEHVVVYDSERALVWEENSEIVQRWWNLAELTALATKAGMQVKVHELKFNRELYLELSK